MLDGVYQNPAQSISQRLMVGVLPTDKHTLDIRGARMTVRERERERPKKKSE